MNKRSLLITCLISTIFIAISCKQPVDSSKYKDLPKDLAELCVKIDKSPNNADLYTQRAEYYILNKNIDSAFADALKALRLDSSNSKRYNYLSDIYFMKGDFESSEDLLERALLRNPNDAETIMKLAELSLYYKRYAEMYTYIDKALTIDQRNPKAHLLKGFGYIEQKDTIGAVREFQLAVDQDPKYYEAYIQLGLVFHRKQNKLALDYYNNALNIRPQSIEAMYNIAMFYQDTKNYDKAIEQYKMILQIDKKNTNATHNIGWIQLEINKNYPEAINYFSQSIDSDPNFINALYNRGLAYERMKKYNEAISDYRKMLQVNPSYSPASEGIQRLHNAGIKG
jgi:tetratricopeptide (TPR) repeat protein